MALPVKALKAGQESYWLDQIARNREEYFSGRGESPGRFVGSAAAAAGLDGIASPEQVQAMFQGLDPAIGEVRCVPLPRADPRSKLTAGPLLEALKARADRQGVADLEDLAGSKALQGDVRSVRAACRLVLQSQFGWGRLPAFRSRGRGDMAQAVRRSAWPSGEVEQAEKQARVWADRLVELHQRIGGRFGRVEPRRRALAYLRGLLSQVEHKNSWWLAEQAGEVTPDGMQRLLNGSRWDADGVRDDLRDYVVEQLGDPDAVLVLDETGFVKKGDRSAGVQRQYTGTAGKQENCQVAVLLAYAAPGGVALVDRDLYLPKSWTDDRARCRATGIPDEVGFQTKPQLGQVMLERALAAGVPFGWVTGDAVYGGDRRLRVWLEEHAIRHVMAVKCTEPVWALTDRGPGQVAAQDLIAEVEPAQWLRLNAGDGSKGKRFYDWTRVPLWRWGWPANVGFWLLARRSLSDPGELAYYVCFAPAATPLVTLVQVAGKRWRVEEAFEQAKGEVGLDHYQVRQYPAWYRHITLAMAALAFLAATRARLPDAADGLGGWSW